MKTSETDTLPIDIARLLDDGPVSPMQKMVVMLAALGVILDGFNGQLIGYAIPVLMKQWGKTKSDFAPAVASGLVGMVIGSACAGLLADRFGRRKALVGSTLLFGVATFVVGFASDISILAALRFVAGLGIGGALPTATTVTAEFMPARWRTLAVTATIVCVPGGGMFAGFVAASVLSRSGWSSLFFVGGLGAIGFGVVLGLSLPETPRFLARHSRTWPELVALLERLSRPIAPASTFMDPAEQGGTKSANFGTLFAGSLRRDTISLWMAGLVCFWVVYCAFSWLPTALSSEGLSPSMASYGLAAWNLGGVLGALLCAAAVTRFGSRWPLAFCCLGAAATSFVLRDVNALKSTHLMIYGLGVHGFFVNAVQSLLFALCAFVYPTSIRATGTASALAFGRIGAIGSAFGGVYLIIRGGAPAFLGMLSLSMLLVLAALMIGKRRIPALARRASRGVASTSAS